jgi:hypothetical protein
MIEIDRSFSSMLQRVEVPFRAPKKLNADVLPEESRGLFRLRAIPGKM